MYKVRKGTQADIDELERLYDDLNDYLSSHTNYAGWKKGIYPIREDAEQGIAENNLFVALKDNKIAGTVILNHVPEDGYRQADWHMDLEDSEVLVVHTFAVHPDYLQQGIGRRIMEFVIDYAAQMTAKAIRLDVYEKNIPAIKLYEKMGFEYIDTVDLGYSPYGLDLFRLYQRVQNPGYTIADIEALPEGQRAELFDGEMIMMSSPTVTHQAILSWLHVEIYAQIREKGGRCRVFPAPFAVFVMDDDKNYVEPDIVVICDRDKLDNKGCHGAPDWVIEIVSSSSRKLDYYRKLEVYQRAGVREYWIVDSFRKTILVHSLEQGEIPTIYHFTDAVKAGIYEDITIDFSKMTDYEFENSKE